MVVFPVGNRRFVVPIVVVDWWRGGDRDIIPSVPLFPPRQFPSVGEFIVTGLLKVLFLIGYVWLILDF